MTLAETPFVERHPSPPKEKRSRPNPLTVPTAPARLEDLGVSPSVVSDLALKLSNTVPRLTSDWAADQLKLPHPIIEQIFWQLREDQFLEILGQTAPGTYRYTITHRGREYASRLLEISGYIGPAPVSLEAYTSMLDHQLAHIPAPGVEQIRAALRSMVLPDETVEIASLAAASGRSLFLFGPPGNGKTTLGKLLHQTVAGDIWIPHCINIESHIIRIYDPQCHQLVNETDAPKQPLDQRWVRIHRPFVMAGGEMTLSELDLAYSSAMRFYEAPPHVKANGGVFLLDDFGRQQLNARELLNRWIIPLEQNLDHLTLNTGQKIRVPFRLMLIVATNLQVSDVADPAFLRRMGYRLHLDKQTPDRYAEIFKRFSASLGVDSDPALIDHVLLRYATEKRDLRASEPRDLITRVRDICNLRGEKLTLSPELLDLAWTGYFGHT